VVEQEIYMSSRFSRKGTCFLFRIGVLFLALLGIRCQSREPGDTAELEQRVKQLESAVSGVGEVMSATQLHFGKLFYAARAKNWKLAAFEIDEVKENIEKAAVLRPEENGVRLGGVVDAFERTQIALLSDAVERQDPEAFRNGYAGALEVCNSCHRATGRPFIVIIEPTAPPVPNQQWTMTPEAR
jgi:hypothetical protein